MWVGHSCPTPLTLILVLTLTLVWKAHVEEPNLKVKINIKGVGQECPTHTGYVNNKDSRIPQLEKFSALYSS